MSQATHTTHNRTQAARPGERGTVMIAAISALFLASAILGGMFAVAKSAGEMAGGVARGSTLQNFADGIVNLCPRIIDAAYEIGDFKGQPLINAFTSAQGIDVTLEDPNLFAELGGPGGPSPATQPSETYFSDRPGANQFDPDFEFSDGEYTAVLDLDYIGEGLGGGSGGPAGGGFTESGRVLGVAQCPTCDDGGTDYGTGRPGVFRCYVQATDSRDRQAVTYGIFRKI